MAPLPLQKRDLQSNRGRGMCHFLNLQEDNVRFILLGVFLCLYLAFGAFMFQAVEESNETKLRRDFQHLYDQFVLNFTNCYSLVALKPQDLKKFDFRIEQEEHENKTEKIHPVRNKSEPFQVTLDGLHELLFSYGNATKAGVLWKRKRWDWPGSFHFAWTIVSTIGYGATTPCTTLGKLLIIPYGFIGCAGGLLFFNLFLERIITFLATCMRRYRLQRQKRRPCIDGDLATDTRPPDPRDAAGSVAAAAVSISVAAARSRTSPSRSSTGEESTVEQVDWKPSVYWVMLCLFVMSFIIIGSSGILFQAMEGWSFEESVYFSFVSYATIGLGDYVSLQQQSYGPFDTMYRITAMGIMVFGCCCIYSLLNVTSIVIKQFLNYIIKKLDECGDYCCCVHCRSSVVKVRRRLSSRRRSKRPRNLRSIRNHVKNSRNRDMRISVLNKTPSRDKGLSLAAPSPDFSDTECEGEPGSALNGSRYDLDERRCSGENIISIRGELSNKVSLAVMQKRLYETAQMSRHSTCNEYPTFSATSVGPLAIVTEKLGDNPV